jgi:hypothetical protein
MSTDSTVDTAILYSRPSAQVIVAPNTEVAQEIRELSELLRLVDALPAEYQPDLYIALDRLAANLEHRYQMLGYVQESLNQMSLDLKYLIFDLEVTRRERDEFRSMLETM